MKFGIRGQLTDVIMCVKSLVDRFRGYGVLTPQKLSFPIDLLRRPYNSVALPCNTVICMIVRDYAFTDTAEDNKGPPILYCEFEAALNEL